MARLAANGIAIGVSTVEWDDVETTIGTKWGTELSRKVLLPDYFTWIINMVHKWKRCTYGQFTRARWGHSPQSRTVFSGVVLALSSFLLASWSKFIGNWLRARVTCALGRRASSCLLARNVCRRSQRWIINVNNWFDWLARAMDHKGI